jgi:hypothetical protein
VDGSGRLSGWNIHEQKNRMSVSRRTSTIIGTLAALGIGLGGSTWALAQWQNSPLMKGFTDNWSSSAQNVVGQLASNEGLYVDMKDFKIAKGMAKGDASAQITKLGARKVSDGAIIFRSGDDLYIVDSRPPASTQ